MGAAARTTSAAGRTSSGAASSTTAGRRTSFYGHGKGRFQIFVFHSDCLLPLLIRIITGTHLRNYRHIRNPMFCTVKCRNNAKIFNCRSLFECHVCRHKQLHVVQLIIIASGKHLHPIVISLPSRKMSKIVIHNICIMPRTVHPPIHNGRRARISPCYIFSHGTGVIADLIKNRKTAASIRPGMGILLSQLFFSYISPCLHKGNHGKRKVSFLHTVLIGNLKHGPFP